MRKRLALPVRLRGSVFVTAGAMLATLALVSGGAVPAAAEPTTVEQAKVALAAIEDQASQIDSQYAALQERQAANRARLAQTRIDIEKQSAKLATLRQRVSQVALAEWRNRGFDTTTQLMSTPDTDMFLNRLSTVQQLANNTHELIAEFELEQANLADIQRSAAADEKAIEEDEATLARLKKQSEAKVEEAKALLNRLTSVQLAQLRAGRTTTSRSVDRSGDGQASARALQALAYAEAQVGKRYALGGVGPSAYDCSGLTQVAFRTAGISIPRTSQEQYAIGRKVSLSELLPGDLIFYYSSVSHVAIYVGSGVMVHAANSYTGVVYDPVSLMPVVGARRIA